MGSPCRLTRQVCPSLGMLTRKKADPGSHSVQSVHNSKWVFFVLFGMGTDQEGIFSCITQSEPRIVVPSLHPFCVIPTHLKEVMKSFLKNKMTAPPTPEFSL